MNSFNGKVILLTGAAGGLGREFARQLLPAGARLILTDIDNNILQEAATQISDELYEAPGVILGTFGGDLSSMDGCKAVYENCTKFSEVDILINNAGIINYGYFHEIPEENYELLMNVNLLAPMRLTHLFLPQMVKRNSGQIVFMCSVAGYIPTSLGTPYSTSKFGIRGFGMGLSGELREFGISTTIIYPSWVNTQLLKSPEYGEAAVGKLPGILAEKPEKVVKQAVKSILKRKRHVYPSLFSRIVWYGTKFWPIISKQAH